MISSLILVVACLGHYPHYHGYYYPRFYYPTPSYWFYWYIPPATPGRVYRPEPVDPILGEIGFRNRMLTYLARDAKNPEMRKHYLAALKRLEWERLEYLSRRSYNPSSSPGYPSEDSAGFSAGFKPGQSP